MARYAYFHLYQAEEVITAIRQAIEKSGLTQKEWGARHKLSATYVSDVLNGRRPPAEAICAAVGIEPVTLYRKKGRA